MERPDNEDLLQISFHWENLDETHFTMCHAVALIPGLSRTYSFWGFDTQWTESGTRTFLWFAVGILKLCISFYWTARVQGLVCPVVVLWEIWATSYNPKIHRSIKGAEQGHSSTIVMEAMEGLHSTNNYATIRYSFAPYNISGVHSTPPWVTGAVRAAAGAHESQRGPGRIGGHEGHNIRLDRATPCLQGEGLGREVANGHFGLFICFFPGFSIIPFWGALIFILACFRLCCTPSWGPASCRHAILILSPNFRAFIPVLEECKCYRD